MNSRNKFSTKHCIYLTLILSILFSHTLSIGQDVSGIVTDAVTGEPLHMVNVYLNNTTLGDATDIKGEFIIKNVTPGYYEIIVSIIGYEFFKKRIEIKAAGKNIFNFEMILEPIIAPTLKVEAARPKEWLKHLEKFKKAFLGATPNAKKCEIKNTEYISFSYSDITNVLIAFSHHPLEIINQGLGYKLNIYLVDFKYNELTRNIHYEYNAKFQPLEPKDEKEKKQWQKNRVKAYYGSKRHFMHSLLTQSLEEEGFQMNSALTMDIGHDPFKKKLYAKDVLSLNNILYFPEYLEVIYTREVLPKDYKEYLKDNHLQQPEYYQNSWLKLNYLGGVVVNKNGSIYDPYNVLIVYGFWTWERVADSLPLDYNPEQ